VLDVEVLNLMVVLKLEGDFIPFKEARNRVKEREKENERTSVKDV
jgi:hypothetical protein